MRPILDVVAVGPVERSLLEAVGERLAPHGFAPRVVEGGPAVKALVGPQSARLNALNILPALHKERGEHVLALTELPLHDGVNVWVFGMGEVKGRCAVFSAHPFRRGGIGPDALAQRIAAAVLHELAHNLGMVHCRKKGCLMHATHEPAALRQLEPSFCADCERSWRGRIRADPRGGSTARAGSARGAP